MSSSTNDVQRLVYDSSSRIEHCESDVCKNRTTTDDVDVEFPKETFDTTESTATTNDFVSMITNNANAATSGSTSDEPSSSETAHPSKQQRRLDATTNASPSCTMNSDRNEMNQPQQEQRAVDGDRLFKQVDQFKPSVSNTADKRPLTKIVVTVYYF